MSRKTTRLPNAYGATQHWIARAVRRAGVHLLFLPQYSPDLTPIEQVFAKLKGMLRKVNARSIAAVWHRIGELLRRFTRPSAATISVTLDTLHPEPITL